MAQLRCAQTSELLAEGSPLEIATAAEAFAAGDVIFDGVGEKFDPAAVRKFRADEIAGLRAIVDQAPANPSDPERQRLDGVRATITERKQRIANGQKLVAQARELKQAALARVEQRKRGA